MLIALACRSLAVPGGRERDCLEIAAGLGRLGHRVTLVTTALPPGGLANAAASGFEVAPLAGKGRSNHARAWNFALAFDAWRAANPVDTVIGFDWMFGLDFHYSADQPWHRRRGLRALLPRHRTYLALERAVFGPASGTYVFFLARPQAENYARLHHLAAHRHEVLPPFVRSDRSLPEEFYGARERVRRELGIPPGHAVLIHVALYDLQKGADRIVDAMAEIPRTILVCVGLQSTGRIEALAARRGIAGRVRTVGYTTDVADLIGAADLMVHPARVETTGSVILESLLYGTPVIATAVCGYAEHIAHSGAGVVVEEPFDVGRLRQAIASSLASAVLDEMRRNARTYAARIAASFGMDAVTEAIARTVARRAKTRCGGHRDG
jgi:UDP-glucose:(heptosyl)LPS alpha-1,3-glucosyltransferase